jgi:NTE family protein
LSKALVCIALFVLLNPPLTCEASPTVKFVPSAQQNCNGVTLVLGGGALKSVGEIGVLQVLKEQNIPIDYVYGTSCGSAIGAMYASGMSPDEIANLFLTGRWQRAVGNHFYWKALCLPLTKLVPLSARNEWPGVLDGRHYEKLLKTKLPATFDQLPIRFRAIAVDLCTGNPVVLSSGSLSQAVLASSAMPPAIRPVEIGGALLADGGLRSNLPTLCAQRAGEGQITIVVSSDGPVSIRNKQYFNSLQRINRRAADLLSFQADENARSAATILITPNIDDLPVMTKNRHKIQAAIEAGRQAALEKLPAIRQALRSR